jgi:hypothetical protein
MCEPMTIATLVTTTISTAIGMYSQKVGADANARAQKNAALANAQAAENQSALERGLAQAEIEKGATEADRQRREALRRMGALRNEMGASGFEMDSGTTRSLLAESAGEEQMDIDIINRNAQTAAWQHQVNATNADNSQSSYLYQASQAGKDGGATALGMGGTLLGGIAAGLGQYNALTKYNTPTTTGSVKFKTPIFGSYTTGSVK